MSKLTDYENKLITEYLVDWNAARAIREAGYVGQFARQTAYRLLRLPHVAVELDRRRKEIMDKSELKVIDVVRNITQVINADARDMMEIHRGACRYCYGAMFLYQYTPQEYRDEFTKHMRSEDYLERGVPFNPQGGDGYTPKRDPHPECPECHGDGVARTLVHDTRTLSPEAATLYAGVKETNGGIEVLTRAKDKAIEQAARYLGMNKETLQITTAPSGLNHFYGSTSEANDSDPQSGA